MSTAAAGSWRTGIASVDAIIELIRRTTDELPVLMRDTPVAAPPFPVEPETAAEPALPRVGGTPAAGTGWGTPPGTDTSLGPGTDAAAPGRATEPAVLSVAAAAGCPGKLWRVEEAELAVADGAAMDPARPVAALPGTGLLPPAPGPPAPRAPPGAGTPGAPPTAGAADAPALENPCAAGTPPLVRAGPVPVKGVLGAVVGAGFDGLAAELLGEPGNGTPAPPLPFKDPPMSVLLAGGVLGRVLLAGRVLGRVLLAGGVLGRVLLAGGVLGTVPLAGGVLGRVPLAGGVLGRVPLAGGVLGRVPLPVRDAPVDALLGKPAVDPGRADPNDLRPTLVPAPATGCGRRP